MNCAWERVGSGSAIALLSQFEVSSADAWGGNTLLSLEFLTLFTSGRFISSISLNYNKNCKLVVCLDLKSSSKRLSVLSLLWIPVNFKSKPCRVSSTGSFNGSVRRPSNIAHSLVDYFRYDAERYTSSKHKFKLQV